MINTNSKGSKFKGSYLNLKRINVDDQMVEDKSSETDSVVG